MKLLNPCLWAGFVLVWLASNLQAQTAEPPPPANQTSTSASVPVDEALQNLLNQGYAHLARSEWNEAVASFEQATRLRPQATKPWLELAFALVANQQHEKAVKALEEVLRLEPTNLVARSQLGYLLIRLERLREAIDIFLMVEQRDQQNFHYKLQLGYLYDGVNNKQKAREWFLAASLAPDPAIRQKAQEALKNLAPVLFARRWIWANEIYAAPFYQARFNNFIAPFIWRSGLVLSAKAGLEVYASTRLTRDTRSTAGGAPQIFSDNFAVLALGLRGRPFKNALTVYGEAGLAINLMPSTHSTVRARSDYRFGTYFSHLWGKRAATPALAFPFNPVGEVYFDVSYYSRFRHNIIGYVQARQGVRVLQYKETALEIYGRGNLVKDRGRDYYNNLAELGAGAAFTPWRCAGIKLTAEYLRGRYFGLHRPNEPNPYRSHYGDFRFGVIFGKYLVKE
ncbi:MAG: tetratricopeptide repeat protein [Acidobacteria bacterium]|nr:tetratricopeptide repeat protein [Acidobacteriota bacterium]MBI3426601.1 tetratricopeptide repeat protein [Acidobacteriota bacterium]